jgi:hypothetical protein
MGFSTFLEAPTLLVSPDLPPMHIVILGLGREFADRDVSDRAGATLWVNALSWISHGSGKLIVDGTQDSGNRSDAYAAAYRVDVRVVAI